MQEKIKMPDHIVRAYNDNKVMDAQSVHGYQSVWMAHWKNTSSKAATQDDHNHLPVDCESNREIKDDITAGQDNVHGGSNVAIDISKRTGANREATKATTVAIMSENLTENPGKSNTGSLDFKSFPIFNQSEKRDGTLSLKGEQYAISHVDVLKSQTDASLGDNNVSPSKTEIHFPSASAHLPPKAETLSRECHLWSERVLPKNPLMKAPDDFVTSTSDMMPYALNKGKNSMPSSYEQCEIYQSSYKLASREHFTSTSCHSYSSLLIQEKKISSLLDPRTSWFSRFKQSGPVHLPHDPSANCYGDQDFVSDHHQKMQSYTGTGFYHGSSPLLQLPSSAQDVNTMKKYTTIGFRDYSSRGHPKFSQTPHYLLMSENNDVNLTDRGQFHQDSITPTKSNQITITEIPDSPSPIGENPQEAQVGSTNREVKVNVQDLKATSSLNNESSAETDTLDINALREDQLPGDLTLPSNKCPKEPTCQGATTTASERTNTELVNIAIPDINQGPLVLHTLTRSLDDREISSSRTQSLDAEHLLSHVKEPGEEPSTRWVKRLKSCSSDSALGTKSEKIGETSSHGKVNMIFSKIMKGSKTSLDPKLISLTEEQNAPDILETVSSNGKSTFVKTKQTVEVALSHPWIRRWSHDSAASSPTDRGESMELQKPHSSDNVMEEGFQKKQYPSIAAMALMGKSMGNLHPCQFVKKGPLLVWNTEKL